MMIDFLIGCFTGAVFMLIALKYAEAKANKERASHEANEASLTAQNRKLEAEHNYRLGWDAHMADDEQYIQSLLRENLSIRNENDDLRKEMNSSLMFADTFSKGGSVRVTAIRRRAGDEATRP